MPRAFPYQIFAALLAASTVGGCAARCAVKEGERAELYPTYAQWDAEAKEWKVPVHGRIYEPAMGPTARSAMALLRTAMKLTDAMAPARVFEERAQQFLVKAPDGRGVRVQVVDKFYPADKVDRGGHFEETVRIPAKRVEEQKKQNAEAPLSYDVAACGSDASYSGEVFLIEENGTSVVSTLEDTVQEMHLDQRAQLLKNVLFRDYQVVPGMAGLFENWRRDGAQFHYVAVAPWQLYPPLSRFLKMEGFPPGTFHMSRWADSGEGVLERLENIVGLFGSERGQKTARISELLDAFPKRRFILVGNTAGSDPEVFGDLWRRYADRIRRVYLRDSGGKNAEKRVSAALASMPRSSWQVFSDPAEVSFDLTRRQ